MFLAERRALLRACAIGSLGGLLAPWSRARAAVKAREEVSLGRAIARAQDLLQESLRAHGSVAAAPFSLRCEGTFNDLGHYERPKLLRQYQVGYRITFDGPKDEVRLTGTLAGHGESATRTLSVTARRLHDLDFWDTQPAADTPEARSRARHRAAELLPSLLLQLAGSPGRTLRWLGATQLEGRPCDAISFTDGAGVPRALYLDRRTHLVRRVEALEADPLFGDDLRTIEYPRHQTRDGVVFPASVRRKRLWYVEEELTCTGVPAPVELTIPPPDKLAAAGAPAPRVAVEKLGQGLYGLRLEHLNNLVLFAEREDHVIAMEAPLNSETGELIIETIKNTTRGKPLRHLLLSHHHPDYVGGIRPFVARDVQLITTPGNTDYLRTIAERPRRLEPDLQARSPRPLQVQAVKTKLVLGEGDRAIEIHDVGKWIKHTDEYLIYYFPGERLLFQGDLAPVKAGAPLKPAGDRGLALLDSIEALGLKVDRILQSWPIQDTVKVLPIATLREMVRLRRQRDGQSP